MRLPFPPNAPHHSQSSRRLPSRSAPALHPSIQHQYILDTTVHYISYQELSHVYKTYPEFNYVGRELVQKYYKLSEQRLYSLRMQRGPERYAYLIEHHPELVQRVEQKYLASYLGITEQYLSMMRSVPKKRRETSNVRRER
jgi:hypothetical protein